MSDGLKITISERLPLGHGRHEHIIFYLCYFVESHDPRGWGYFGNLQEVCIILVAR